MSARAVGSWVCTQGLHATQRVGICILGVLQRRPSSSPGGCATSCRRASNCRRRVHAHTAQQHARWGWVGHSSPVALAKQGEIHGGGSRAAALCWVAGTQRRRFRAWAHTPFPALASLRGSTGHGHARGIACRPLVAAGGWGGRVVSDANGSTTGLPACQQRLRWSSRDSVPGTAHSLAPNWHGAHGFCVAREVCLWNR